MTPGGAPAATRPQTERLLRAAREAGLFTAAVQEDVLLEARRARRDPLDVASHRLRLPAEAFYRALARAQGLPFLDAAELEPDPDLLQRLPRSLLTRRRLLPVRRPEERTEGAGGPWIATSDPDDVPAVEALRGLLGAPPRLVVTTPAALEAALEGLAGGGPAGAFDPVRFLDELMGEAYLRRASDVHLGPSEEGLAVRLRVDGRLRPYGRPLPVEAAVPLLTRVKVLAGLDIAERREPQDGGFTHALGEAGDTIDVRVATIPTSHGERATLRLLGAETAELTVAQLGFGASDLARLRDVLATPHGMVLLTGPTGSGKTTTLYAALREVATPEVNVMTVEDPVEFLLPGVTQIAVDRAGKVSFARALRSILRHDPDVVMVGEIRDGETADVALKAALTGHLVLSSLHTNDAPGAVTRLLDLGCAPYLVGSVLRAVLAQRLVRRLCRGCLCATPPSCEERARLEALALPADDALWTRVASAPGCPACVGTGTRGRTAIVEALWVTADLRRAIAAGDGEAALVARARGEGYRTLAEAALDAARAGETSLAEALRARV